jgi:hypothetical protein
LWNAESMHSPRHRHTRRRWTVAIAGLGIVAAAGIAAAVLLPSSHSDPPRSRTGSQTAPATVPTAVPATTKPTEVATTTPTATPSPSAGPIVKASSRPTLPARATVPRATTATTSSCRAVVHIGDSTSESLISADYLPNPAQRLSARYAHVGATYQNFQISGARSIVETYEGQPNAYTVAREIAASGYKGCWVVDMGINDAADIAAGSRVTAPQRIQRMMSVIGNQPVMWVAVRTLVASGPYAESNMQAWNTALLGACAAHPNMRVFNWAALAQRSYYIPDGIHYNSPGSAILAAALATGLVRAFPASGPAPTECLVP